MMSDQDNELSSLYQQQAQEQPSAELDNAILDMAKQSIKVNKPKTMAKYLPYSAAASVAIVALLVSQFEPAQYVPSVHEPVTQLEPVLEAEEKQAFPQAAPQSIASDAQYDQAPLSAKKRVKQQATKEIIQSISSRNEQRVIQPRDPKARQLEQIKRSIKEAPIQQSLELIEIYIKMYQFDSLPKDVKQFYQQHRAKNNTNGNKGES